MHSVASDSGTPQAQAVASGLSLWLNRFDAMLDGLSRLSGVCGGLALLATSLIVAAQIGARLLGSQIPATDDFSAWAMAASLFLALPYTLRQGGHIRVTLLLHVLPQRLALAFELLSTGVALALVTWGGWHSALYVHDAYLSNEVAQGMVAAPLWIPQLSMPLGLFGLALMLLGRLVAVLRGKPWKEDENE